MSIAVQKQIKDNAQDVSSYFTDLYAWTEEQGKRETRRQGRPTVDRSAATVPASGATGDPSSSSTATAKRKEDDKQLVLNRDGTAMSKYYHDWDQVDVDKLVDDLDEEAHQQQQAERAARQAQKDSILDDLALKGDGDRSRTSMARPRVKIAVRASGRRVAPVDLAAPKKEEANRYLAEGRHREAIATYTAALELLEKYEPPDAASTEASGDGQLSSQAGDCAGENTEALLLKTALLANRSLALMKLEEWRETAADCTEALRFDPQHHKATLRRGFAHARLKLWGRAVPDLQRAVGNDPGDKKAAAELQMARRMLEQQSQEARAHAKRVMCDPTRNLSMPTRKLTVRVQRGTPVGEPCDPVASQAEPPMPGATAAATAQVLRAAAAEVDSGDTGTVDGGVAVAASSTPAPRKPYVPRAVRMRGRQAGQSAAMQAALCGGGAAPAAGEAAMARSCGAVGAAGERVSHTRGIAPAARATPTPPAMNFYTFEAQWTRHRSKPAERMALLKRVGAGALPVLFRESLDAELLASIIEVLRSETNMASQESAALASRVMEALARTPRFDMSLRCLSTEERSACCGLLDRLRPSGACSEVELDQLLCVFGVQSPDAISSAGNTRGSWVSGGAIAADAEAAETSASTGSNAAGTSAAEGATAAGLLKAVPADDSDDAAEPVPKGGVPPAPAFSLDGCD